LIIQILTIHIIIHLPFQGEIHIFKTVIILVKIVRIINLIIQLQLLMKMGRNSSQIDLAIAIGKIIHRKSIHLKKILLINYLLTFKIQIEVFIII